MPVSPIEEIIEEAKAGRMFILVDDETRENEGDLIMPASFTTGEVVNFMITHCRGLVCLALDKARAKELELPLMLRGENQSQFGTNFTLSIEAKEGVTTGISAYERAITIATAIDPKKSANDIVVPGHVFPLIAQKGGVLTRNGHTEASVDICTLAGLNPSAVICEIIREDGHMARLPDLLPFAEKHGLKIGSIADLVEYKKKRAA